MWWGDYSRREFAIMKKEKKEFLAVLSIIIGLMILFGLVIWIIPDKTLIGKIGVCVCVSIEFILFLCLLIIFLEDSDTNIDNDFFGY